MEGGGGGEDGSVRGTQQQLRPSRNRRVSVAVAMSHDAYAHKTSTHNFFPGTLSTFCHN